jgi:hypothetical protein
VGVTTGNGDAKYAPPCGPAGHVRDLPAKRRT